MSCTIGRSSTFGLNPAGRSVASWTQRVGRVVLVADDEPAVLLANGAPRAVEVEQRQAVVLRLDLRVVAARHELGAGSAASLAVWPGVDSSRAKTPAASGFDARSDES